MTAEAAKLSLCGIGYPVMELDSVAIMIWLFVAIALVFAILLWGEFAHWRSSRRRLGGQLSHGTDEVVVVLGFRNRGARANLINRWRVRAGLRSRTPASGSSVLVLCGGAVGSDVTESELMAVYAREKRRYAGPLLTETESRTTWENVQNVIPLVEAADRIKIVSNSLHAEKARAYLWKLRPDLAERLVQANEYRFGELILLKPLMAALGVKNLRSTPV
jgi:uncharacterized SAM-binding protein YcdF (DUF218 family)